MIIFIDTQGLDNTVALHLGQYEKIIFFHAYKDVKIKGQSIIYDSLDKLNTLNSTSVEIVIIIGDFNILGKVYAMFPESKIVITLGKEIPSNISINIPFTLVAPLNSNMRNIIYDKISFMMDVFEVGKIDDWNKLIKNLGKEKLDLTSMDSEPLKILLIKRSRLADAPDELVKAINRYTQHHADIDCKAKEGYHILHYNNIYFPAKHNSKVIQYHSEPSRVTFAKHFGNAPTFPKKQLVLSQYHATLPEYSHCELVQNVINFENDTYDLKHQERGTKFFKIGYSPSVTQKVNIYYDKGYEKTKAILESIEGIEFDIITGVSLTECIKRKSSCDIIIDECVTGSFHRSGLEGLALGKMTICWLNNETEKMLKDFTSTEIPFENIHIDNLKEFLIKCCDFPLEEIHKVGEKNRIWMEKNWHPKIIAEKFISIYRDVISKNP